jgi:hypothetical protein
MKIDIRLKTLHPAQQIIAQSPVRFKVLACGRRFGKTSVAVDELTNRLLDGQRTAYFAPTFRMGGEVWRELKAALRPLMVQVSETTRRFDLLTGGTLECWSLSPGAAETVRGRKYHYVVLDEAALVEAGEAWQSAIRPLLTDYAGGALFCSTPRGRNWFWELYQRGQNPDWPDWGSWRFGTAANPFIAPAEIEAARGDLPERFFQQEYEAAFLDDGGAVFRQVDRACTAPPQAQTAEAVVFGVDWGKENDFTAVSVMTRGGRQVWLERFNHIGWAQQRGRLAALAERYRPALILAEENSIGSVNIEALHNEGLPVRPFVTSAKSKPPLIDALALALERGEITLLDDPVLKHELLAYTLQRGAHGWQYQAPHGGHDDTVMATALSWWAVTRIGTTGISFA